MLPTLLADSLWQSLLILVGVLSLIVAVILLGAAIATARDPYVELRARSGNESKGDDWERTLGWALAFGVVGGIALFIAQT